MVQAARDLTKEAKSVSRYLKIAPRKMRLVINAIRFQPVYKAFGGLLGLKKKAARLVEQGLKSAVANAKVKNLEENRLIVSEGRADGGPMMKRFMSRSMGRADQILKRSTHLTIIVRELQRQLASQTPAEAPEKEKKAKIQKPKKTGFAGKGTKTRKAAAKA